MSGELERAALDAESSDSVEEGHAPGGLHRTSSTSTKARAVVLGSVLLCGVLGVVALQHFRGVAVREGSHERKSLVAFAEDGPNAEDKADYDPSKPCGGKCHGGYKCAEKPDGSYAQCVNCNGNYKYDCTAYDNDLRIAAIIACKKPCELKPPVAPCGLGSVFADYAKGRCEKQEDGSISVVCEAPNPQHCGLRLTSMFFTGMGTFSVAMQPAAGAGLSSGFSMHKPWNEIKFEVLGAMCGKKPSKVYTVFWAGKFNASAPEWNRRPQHKKFVTVPFDPCADWHTYTIAIDNKTISWLIDGKPYRSEDITIYDDMLEAVAERGFQTRFEVRGQDQSTGNFPDQGYLIDSEVPFPGYTWYANLDQQPADEEEEAEEEEQPAAGASEAAEEEE